MPLFVCGKLKNTWAAEVKRTPRTEKNIVAQATLGVMWQTSQTKKALEL